MSLPNAATDRDRVGPYVLVKAIGAGGSARVDLARIERAYGFQRHVVIKRPLEHLRADPRAAESIRREARLGGRLRHPNLIQILDAGVYDGYDYLVLEYVHGGSLRELMQTDEGARVRDVSLEVALAIVRDVARGVHEAHELHDDHGAPLGLVHRDVSPGNVLVGLDGAVKLADFGIAKETRVTTLSGSMHGTVTYMAPEQCRGHAFDRRADVFSLGVILYELVTGSRLFWADNDVASLHRVLAGTVLRPRKLRASIAPELEDIIMTAVAHEQDKRFATARAFADALEAYGTSTGHILAARCVAGWTHEILGARDAPWIGGETVVDFRLPEAEGPLVDIIAAEPADEPPSPTFGPSDATLFEDSPTDRDRAAPVVRPARSRRPLILGVLGVAVAAGVVAVLLMSRGTPSPAPAAEAPVTMPAQAATVDAAATAPAVADEATEEEIEVDDPVEPPTPGKPARHKRKKRPKTVTKPTDPKIPNVEWNPGMLLPTDDKKR